MRKCVYFLLLIGAVSCSSGDQQAQDLPVITDTFVPVTDSVKVPETPAPRTPGAGLELFQNIVQISYCVPLPLEEYPMDHSENLERAHFSFKNRHNKKYAIDLQGLFRSEPAVTIEDYFKNSYTEEQEAEGKVITEKKLIPGTGCFYAKGFWSNLGDKQRFTEITWLRSDDVVVLKADYPVEDTTTWNQYLAEMITFDSNCQ